ncbi:hypothetical protein GCM10011506_18450 [Marivirga lumbricoides]|uniref:PRC-barrel domain-containing protein n=1 Tax=Marivirga lumbricoides TaxID=1046115 RepID=A0ABQ1M2S2_9BACT|nr:hypothetical protein GCM10011506_18450 [Marivirga lumbricoides]
MQSENNDLVLSTSTLEGSKVKNLSNETVGEIKDIMLDADTGEVQYVVLSVNTGFLNLESKYFAIPWQVFSFNTVDEVLVLDIDKDRLKNSPGFDKDNWPKGPQSEFINEVNTYYGVESNRVNRVAARTPGL